MSIDRKLREAVYEKTNHKCGYCGKSLEYRDMTVDHITAKSKGGTDTYDNFLACCKTCNHAKKDLSLSRFRRLIQRTLMRLHKEVELYRVALQYGFVKEKPVDKVVFYFETLGELESRKDLDPKIEPTINWSSSELNVYDQWIEENI